MKTSSLDYSTAVNSDILKHKLFNVYCGCAREVITTQGHNECCICIASVRFVCYFIKGKKQRAQKMPQSSI